MAPQSARGDVGNLPARRSVSLCCHGHRIPRYPLVHTDKDMDRDMDTDMDTDMGTDKDADTDMDTDMDTDTDTQIRTQTQIEILIH